MAEKALKKVEDQLNCSICLDTYTNPKLLQCFHVFCQKCLVKLVVRDQQGQLVLTCPICHQDTPGPANGVAGLPPDFRINHLLEIMEEHKRTAADTSASAEKVEGVSTSLTSKDNVKVSCSEHGGKEVGLYCETCGELICYKCAVKGGKHHDHSYEELDKAFQKYKEEITVYLQPMEKQLTTTNQALAQLDTRCEEISDQQAAIEADIHSTFQRLQEILEVRRTEVIDKLHQITERKLKSLAVQRDQIETTQAQLSSCLGFMKESLKTDSQEEALSLKTMVVKQAKELTIPSPPDMLKANTEADVVFLASIDVMNICQKYGQVLAPSLPDPSKCHATGKGTEAAVVGETSTAVLQVIDFRGQPCEEPLECELVSAITGMRTQGSMERKAKGQYEISYQPCVKGRHQLHIKAQGQHIRGSPFSVAVRSSAEKLSSPILTIGGVKRPWGVAISQRGEVVVTESNADCVSVFSISGERLQSFGTRGSGQGQFNSPCGLAVDGEGNILVADRGNHRIQKFTADGQFLAAVGTEGSGPLQFDKLYCIAFNSSNNKVYVSERNCRIQILNSDLTFSSTFGSHGNGKGQFNWPYGIACDSTGNVYVTDFVNNRIQVFTADGKFLRQGREKLNSPTGIAIDASDMVYMSENANRVSMFTLEGLFVRWFCHPDFQFKHPHELAIDNSGVLYVCDSLNNCIQML